MNKAQLRELWQIHIDEALNQGMTRRSESRSRRAFRPSRTQSVEIFRRAILTTNSYIIGLCLLFLKKAQELGNHRKWEENISLAQLPMLATIQLLQAIFTPAT